MARRYSCPPLLFRTISARKLGKLAEVTDAESRSLASSFPPDEPEDIALVHAVIVHEMKPCLQSSSSCWCVLYMEANWRLGAG